MAGISLSLWLLTRQWRSLLAVLASYLLGLALSAWFWLPALLEGKYVQLGRIVASDFRPRFIALAELIALSPRLDTGSINPFFPLTLGAVQVWMASVGLLLLILGIVFLIRRKRIDPLIAASGLFFSSLTLFCAFMATAGSEPVWRALPFLDLFEWPFRWHGFTVVGLSWLCAFSVFGITYYLRRWSPAIKPNLIGSNLVGSLALLLLIGSALVNLYPKLLPLDTLKSSPADVVRFEARSNTIGTTSLGEFNPIWADNALASLPSLDDYRRHRPINRLPSKLPIGGRSTLELSSTQTHQFHLSLPMSITVTLNLLYFPGWQATVDGIGVAATPHPGSGLLDVHLPAGDHTLRLHFGETPLRALADSIAIVAWSGLILFIMVRKGLQRKAAEPQRRKDNGVETESNSGWSWLATLAVSVGLLLGVYLFLPDWFQLHSQADQARAAATPLHVDFGNQLRLLGIDPPLTTVAPGDSVTVVTYWRALQRLPDNYGIFLHLDMPNGQTMATVDQSHLADIPTSSWAPSLYVRVPLRLIIPPGTLPIRYQLRVGIVNAQNENWLPFLNHQADARQLTGDALAIGELWVEPSTVAQAIGPRAQFGPFIHLIGLHYNHTSHTITLQWQTDTPIVKDYTIFVHALDANGTILGQSDATPYQNQYPTSAWQPQQTVEDQRSLDNLVKQPNAISGFAIGLYDPASGERLPATDETGKPLADNRLVIEIAHLK